MKAWGDLSSPQILDALRDHAALDYKGRTSKQELVGMAETLLGPDADNPALRPPNGQQEQAAVVSDGRTIHQRLADVLADLPAIGKDEQAPGNMGGYRYRGIEQITAALKPLLAKHGVTMTPRILDRIDSVRLVGRDEKSMYVVDLLIEFTFHGTCGDSVVASMWGEGTDMGDKAPQKAVTSAFKSTLGITFCVSDSATDSERHVVPETERPALASAADKKIIGQWIAVIPEENREAVKASAVERFGPAADLTAAQVGPLIDWLEMQAKAFTPIFPPVAVPDDGPLAEGEALCSTCDGAGLMYDPDDRTEVICRVCEGEKIVCVECLRSLDGHLPECSRRPFGQEAPRG